MAERDQGYWYLASYPKSGNTWCRVFLTELLRLAGDGEPEALNLNRDLKTGIIASSRLWLEDQLGINSCDLSFAELDPLRGRAGESTWLFAEGERFHKVHDAFRSPDSRGRPAVSTAGCHGVVYLLRHPEDVAVSLRHFFSCPLARCVDFLLDPASALVPSDRHGGQQVRQHLGRWDQHVVSWVDQAQLPVLVIRYEDMLARGSKTFTALAQFLDLPTEQTPIDQALANTTTERWQQLEMQVGGFAEKPKGCERFFRSGRTGEGAEQLSRELRRQLAAGLAEELHAFWRLHQAAYQAEIKRFRITAQRHDAVAEPGRPLRRQPVAVARGSSGKILGVVFVVLRELNPDLHLGTHAYFQRMYVDPKARSSRLANQLFKTFLMGFDGAKAERDHRAGVLMSGNINPGLQRSFMRRYFARLGFVMLGSNKLGGEVWSRRLTTRFVL